MLPTVPLPAQIRVEPALLESARVAQTHRVCAPKHASFVRSACLYDRSVLPRWHQDDRGDRNAHRGVHHRAQEGAYRGVRVWNGRQHWLAFVVPAAIALAKLEQPPAASTGSPEPARSTRPGADTGASGTASTRDAAATSGTTKSGGLFAIEELSPATFALWARVESGYVQDQRTGRRCIVRPATVASVMGCTPNTVRKCRRLARRIGLQVVISMGRMLTATECWAARRRGSSQRGLSTETALTIPSPVHDRLRQLEQQRDSHGPYGAGSVENPARSRDSHPRATRCVPSAVDSVTPTSGRAPDPETHRYSSPLDGARAEKREAAPPPLRPKGGHQPPRTAAPATSARQNHRAAYNLAWQLTKKIPWLRAEQPGRLTPSLTRFATARPGWTAQDVIDALHTLRTRRGLPVGPLTADKIHTRPAVVLAAFLRELDHHDDHPRLAHIDPDELRCHRPECDHGWITIATSSGGPSPTAAGDPVRRCDQCRPGAWPAPHLTHLDDDTYAGYHGDEPPF